MGDNVGMMVTLSAARRADGMLDYSKDGPGECRMPSVMPAVYEKLEAQLKANCASQDEAERFINELDLFAAAKLSFPERRNNLRTF